MFDQKLRLMKVIGAGFPFSWTEALGSPLFDQTSTTQIKKKGTYQKKPKKEAVWGHWEVIGIGEPIFDQKLRPIVAEEVIKILFPCFWSDAINSCENPKSKKYKKKSEKMRHPSTSTVSSWLKSTADFLSCIALQHMQLCVPSILSWTSGKPKVPCFLMIASFLPLYP